MQLPPLTLQEQTKSNHNWQLVHQLQPVGSRVGNVEQGFVLLPQLEQAYSQRVCNTGFSCITKYVYDPQTYTIQGKSSSIGSQLLGHQGISVQLIDSQVYFWTSAGFGITNYGHYAVRFQYLENQAPSNILRVRLFSPDFQERGNTTPAIATTGEYLIAVGEKAQQKYLRVWDLKAQELTTLDWSEKFISQFLLDPLSNSKQYPVQGIASDGKLIYVFLGLYDINFPKLLLTYTLDGKLLGREFIEAGKDIALKSGKEKHWEAEGISLVDNYIYIQIVVGDHRKRVSLLYRRSLDQQLKGLLERVEKN
ncbi:hypothetical protein [Psittacicella gerlachiana]|uniref:Uncharacterized protein n=1 Tax=Psittacicella gerlachiana TaxID=2028574 RepID=A0A3A1YNR4_9GAMM|nr:hypothetical protein [Psittacicella gerlachiana]RIY37924.1 hypothetical protein CKF59_01170 [Psittacicella gerlachiana]